MKGHWTPRYILNRIREWLYHRTHPRAPWLGPRAVRQLQALLHPDAAGFEAGSGRSTAWVGQRVRELLSVEENPVWFADVQKQLQAAGIDTVHLLQVPGDGSAYRPGYERVIEGLPDGSLDFALVDSEHERDYLAAALVPKIKAGGFLMLDNANWFLPCRSHAPHSRAPDAGPLTATWQPFLDAVKDWRCIWTSSGVTDTAFFIKP